MQRANIIIIRMLNYKYTTYYSQRKISRQWCVGEYNANNGWYFNSNNGTLNNNNKYNSFRVRPFLDYGYDNGQLESYETPLSEWYPIIKQCSKRKRSNPSYLIFRFNQTENLINLVHQIGNYEYVPKPPIEFIILSPKQREVMAADFADRLVHTLYYNELISYLEKYMYSDSSYSCRVGKGGLKAIKDFQEHVFDISEGYTKDCYVASNDFKAFFMSIDTDIACNIMYDFIKNTYKGRFANLLTYLTRIIYKSLPQEHCIVKSKPSMRVGLPYSKTLRGKTKGIPIGNLPSQMMANVIMAFMVEYWRNRGYRCVHYTDDLDSVFRNKQQYLWDVKSLEEYTREYLHLEIHPNKKYLQHYSKGIQTLGYKLRYDRILPSDRIAHNVKWKVDCFIRKAKRSKQYMFANKDHILGVINSYYGLLKHCNSYKLRKEIMEKLEHSPFSKVFEFDRERVMKVSVKKELSTINYYTRKAKEKRKNLLKSA